MGSYSMVYVQTRVENYHSWPEAPDDVAFLRNKHRHEFHFKLSIGVEADREIEFFQLKRWLKKLLYTYKSDWADKSCEMISSWLEKQIRNKFGYDRKLRIEISEDGENGSYYEYNPK